MNSSIFDGLASPLIALEGWFDDAERAVGTEQATAMSLATVDSLGNPDLRFVLCKGYDSDLGVIRFFTNTSSPKALQLAHRPYAAAAFWWPNLQRQVRIRGTANQLSRETVAEYFATRDRISQLSAVASRQSQPVASREELQRQVAAATETFPGEVPAPEWWGGYSIFINELEFWQGQPGRLHDRLLYTREERGEWICNRLQP